MDQADRKYRHERMYMRERYGRTLNSDPISNNHTDICWIIFWWIVSKLVTFLIFVAIFSSVFGAIADMISNYFEYSLHDLPYVISVICVSVWAVFSLKSDLASDLCSLIRELEVVCLNDESYWRDLPEN